MKDRVFVRAGHRTLGLALGKHILIEHHLLGASFFPPGATAVHLVTQPLDRLRIVGKVPIRVCRPLVRLLEVAYVLVVDLLDHRLEVSHLLGLWDEGRWG